MITSVSRLFAAYSASSIRAVNDSQATEYSASATRTSKPATDTVEISQAGSKLLDGTTLLLPTPENVRKKSAELEAMMGTIFLENNISNDPPVELSMNSEGEIVVENNHPQAEKIEKALNADDGLKRLFHTVEALSSHARELQKHLQFQEEYRASSNQQAVVAKYAHLFGHRTPQNISMSYGATGIDIMFDGEVWEV